MKAAKDRARKLSVKQIERVMSGFSKSELRLVAKVIDRLARRTP